MERETGTNLDWLRQKARETLTMMGLGLGYRLLRGIAIHLNSPTQKDLRIPTQTGLKMGKAMG